jgi:glycosyltransferase involved in cell wall biosynthesis
MVQRYGSRVRYIYQKNAGPSAARNSGIKAASCSWIAFLDADDEWLPEKQRLQMLLLEQHPELVWSYTNYICSLKNGRQNPAYISDQLQGFENHCENYFAAFANGMVPCSDTVIVKREVFDKAGLFQVGQDSGEDTDMWFRIAFNWPQVGYIVEPLATYHMYNPTSLAGKPISVPLLCRCIKQLLITADTHGQLGDIEPCAKRILRYHIRLLLLRKCEADALELTRQFAGLLSLGYKIRTWFQVMFPGAAWTIANKYNNIKTRIKK